jgi:hypothetical protein
MFLTSRDSVSLLCLSLIIAQSAIAQQGRPTKSTQRAATSIGSKVEEEIQRLDRGSYSSFFSKLSEPGTLAELDLSAQQKSLRTIPGTQSCVYPTKKCYVSERSLPIPGQWHCRES